MMTPTSNSNERNTAIAVADREPGTGADDLSALIDAHRNLPADAFVDVIFRHLVHTRGDDRDLAPEGTVFYTDPR